MNFYNTRSWTKTEKLKNIAFGFAITLVRLQLVTAKNWDKFGDPGLNLLIERHANYGLVQ